MSQVTATFPCLDAAAVGHYHDRGFVVIRNLIPPDLVAGLLERTFDILDGRCEPLGIHHFGAGSNRGPADPGRLNRQIVVTEFPAADPIFRTCAELPALIAAAMKLMDSEMATIFQLQAMVKEPGCANPTPWHQDDGYWQLSARGLQAVTAWMPLLPTAAANGTMWVLPDSHRGEILAHQAAGGQSDYRTVAAPIDESRLVPLELQPGDVQFHHQRTVHGAYPNTGKARRVAIATHYADVPDPRAAMRGETQPKPTSRG